MMTRKYPQRSRCLLTASVPYKILLLSLMWLDTLLKDQFAHKLQKDRFLKSKHKNNPRHSSRGLQIKENVQPC